MLPPIKKLKPRKPVVRERDIEGKVCTYARQRGYLAYKFTSPERPGVPDRLMISPNGAVFFVEFKTPGKHPTHRQEYEIDQLRQRYQHVYVVSSVVEGKQIIDFHFFAPP